MKGRAHAAKRDDEARHLQAWRGENFARSKKLKDFDKYLPKEPDAPAVRPEVILDAMLTMQAHGVPMKIEKR